MSRRTLYLGPFPGLYVDGRLLGGIGDFSRTPPGVMAIQPRLFALPRDLWAVNGQELSTVIAFRVALLKGTSAATAPDGGGMHIAPVLGTEAGVRDHYRLQRLEKAEAFAVDAAEPIFLLILAAMALSMMPFDPKDRFGVWIAAALILLGAAWFNQPIFWMGRFESLKDFVISRVTIIDGFLLGAWIMAWRAAFGLQGLRWIDNACAALTVVYLVARPLSTPLLLPDLPHAVTSGFAGAIRPLGSAFCCCSCCDVARTFAQGQLGVIPHHFDRVSDSVRSRAQRSRCTGHLVPVRRRLVAQRMR